MASNNDNGGIGFPPPPPPFFNEVNIAKGNNNEQIYKSFNEDINAISESRRLSAKSEFRK